MYVCMYVQSRANVYSLSGTILLEIRVMKHECEDIEWILLSVQGLVAGSSECSKKLWGSTKCLSQLNHHLFLQKDSASWIFVHIFCLQYLPPNSSIMTARMSYGNSVLANKLIHTFSKFALQSAMIKGRGMNTNHVTLLRKGCDCSALKVAAICT
jgi:hypothetical protein